MDKYQSNALSNIKFTCVSENSLQGKVSLNGDTLEVNQNENYNIDKYDLCIDAQNIHKVEFFDVKWKNSDQFDGNYVKKTSSALHLVPVSFADKNTKKIRITFKGGLVDPVELTLNYLYADVESWNKKNKKEMLESFSKNISVGNTEGTGTHFETLFFKPCSPICKKTIVEWYLIGEMNNYGDRYKKEDIHIFKAYYLSNDIITDKREYSNSPTIAEGTSSGHIYNWFSKGFAYIIRQYDDKDNLLIEIKSKNFENKLPGFVFPE